MRGSKARALRRLERLHKDVRLASIEVKNERGRFVIDQSLDVTVSGDPAEARKCVLFMFPKLELGDGGAYYSVNRDAIAQLQRHGSREDVDGYGCTAIGVIDGYMVVLRATNWADLGHLINAFRLVGGVDYFDRGQEARHGKR